MAQSFFKIVLSIFILVSHSFIFGIRKGGSHEEPIRIGQTTVWSLYDGYVDLDQTMFVGIEPDQLRQQLIDAEVQCVDDLIVRTDVLGFLIDNGEQLILIDAGGGTRCGPTMGHLLESLRKTGHEPSEVSLVLITHLHPDHYCGLLTEEGVPAFPSATVFVSEVEANYWRDPLQELIAKEDFQPGFPLAREMLAPYEACGKLWLINSGETLAPGVLAIEASGHTPGHMAFLFFLEDQQLLFWGDVVHNAGIQFSNPEWYIFYDSDGEQAVENRKMLFSEAADQHFLVGGAHLPRPGFGHVFRSGNIFFWKPL